MKATDLVICEHRRILRLFADYDSAPDSLEKRRTLYESLALELDIHSRVEEEVFYPAVCDVEAERPRFPVSEALRDHREILLLLGELARTDLGEECFDDRMQLLRTTVENHLEEEEAELIPDALDRLNDATLEELGQEMEDVKGRLLEELRRRKTA
jgi:hypothetical protein